MSALLDTDVLIDHLRGREEARAFLLNCFEAHDTLYVSVITVSEIWAGMRDGEEDDTCSLLDLFQTVPVTNDIAVKAGLYRNRYGQSHGVLLPDALIAATAFEMDAVLYSYNIRLYPMEDVTARDPGNTDVV